MMKIAIIGAGNMGGAIARGLAQGNHSEEIDLIVANPGQSKLDALKEDFPQINVTHDNQAAATGADIVVLAVKPVKIPQVLGKLKLKSRQILVSTAAGVPFETLAHYVPDKKMTMFRIIPNMAISCRQSMTLVCSRNASPEQETLLLELCNDMGLSMLLPECQLPAATSLASCGTAYALMYIRAAMQAGIELGISPQKAQQMVAQCVKGAAELLQKPDSHPSLEIDKVCTPGGLTIKGINRLEEDGFTSAIIHAIRASLPDNDLTLTKHNE